MRSCEVELGSQTGAPPSSMWVGIESLRVVCGQAHSRVNFTVNIVGMTVRHHALRMMSKMASSPTKSVLSSHYMKVAGQKPFLVHARRPTTIIGGHAAGKPKRHFDIHHGFGVLAWLTNAAKIANFIVNFY
eukprot:scaffold2093_cov161-Amphora_coffeaeformis.AAC.2